MEWPELIRQRRDACGLTQTELAVKAGVSLPSIQKMEAGKANPSLKTLSSVFDVLEVDVIFKLRQDEAFQQERALPTEDADKDIALKDAVSTQRDYEPPRSIFSEVASDLGAIAKKKSTRGRVNHFFKLLDKVTDPNRN